MSGVLNPGIWSEKLLKEYVERKSALSATKVVLTIGNLRLTEREVRAAIELKLITDPIIHDAFVAFYAKLKVTK